MSFRTVIMGSAIAMVACADESEAPAITELATPWPRTLAELGTVADGSFTPDGGIAYDVAHPLWSSGSSKARHLVLPEGGAIDDGDREAWRFAAGTVAFKTFADGERPLETRAIRRLVDEWEYAVYLWDGDDAELLDNELAVEIPLDAGGVHTVPARLQCEQCHATAASALLGVNELQLADALPGLDEVGALAHGAPSDPARIDHPDPTTADVLGWFVGNCSHCHNGGDGENASFDLGPDVALANTIDVPIESSVTAAGIRIVPGDPLASVLYLAVSGEHDDPELEDMPPVGIDRRDDAGIAKLRTMIEELGG
jgi:hypothetical protein